jgi:DNA replication licensing factor MCM2
VLLRQESKKSSGLNIVVRHLESLSRLTLASAKLHLRHQTIEKDCDIAIEILLNSFICSQKPSVSLHLKQKFAEFLRKNQNLTIKLTECLNTLINR